MEPETRYNMETETRYSVVENIKSEQIVRALTVMITFLSKIEEQSINKNKGSVNNINYGKLLDAELVVFRERFVADFCNYITQKYFDCLRNTSDFNLATFDNNEDKEIAAFIAAHAGADMNVVANSASTIVLTVK